MLTVLEVTTTGCATVQGIPGMLNHSLQCWLLDALLTYKSSNNALQWCILPSDYNSESLLLLLSHSSGLARHFDTIVESHDAKQQPLPKSSL